MHVAGAGLAGLAAALDCAAAGGTVVLHEAASSAGGRCRSFADRELGATLDNGAHVILGVNRAAFGYLAACGALDRLVAAADAIPVLDLASGRSWSVPVAGHVPLGLLRQPPPGARRRDLFALARRLGGDPAGSVAEAFGPLGPVYRWLIAPLCLAAMNAAPDAVEARAFAPVLRRIAVAGRGGLRPFVARESLSGTFVAPALERLARLGAEVRFGDRLLEIAADGRRASAARFASGAAALAAGDGLVLAVPPPEARRLLPGLALPACAARAIVNVHFRPGAIPPFPGHASMLGLLGGTAQWLFRRRRWLTATASDAGGLLRVAPADAARLMWADAVAALRMAGAPIPAFRVVRERRATWTPSTATGPGSGLANVFLAGDWTVPDLPGTIEAAVLSGRRAAARYLEGAVSAGDDAPSAALRGANACYI